MTDHPNILWIQTDEQRPDSLACYGSAWAKTPHTDRLAAEGTVFQHCVCQSPVCVPSRVSQLFCEYPQECRTLANQVQHASNALPEGIATFPEVFAQAGYRTSSIGKWHTPNHPTWQENEDIQNLPEYAGYCGLHERYNEDEYEVVKRLGGPPVILAGQYPVADGNPSQLITNKGIAFLRAHDRSQPFLLRVSHLWPHVPVLCPPPWNRYYDPDEIPIRYYDARAYATRASYDRRHADANRLRDFPRETIRQIWRDYMGLCAYVDHEVGRLLDALDGLGLRENTIVVYSADHGKSLGEWGATGKNFFDQEVWRVPFIWSWPGRIPAGVRDTTLCELTDMGGTLLQLAGLADRRPARWRGRNLFTDPAPEAVFGQIGWPSTSPPFFAQVTWANKPPAPSRNAEMRMAVRTDRWRMDVTWIRNGLRATREELDGNLFDLVEDPGETCNLFTAADRQPVVEELLERLTRWWNRMRRPRELFGDPGGE